MEEQLLDCRVPWLFPPTPVKKEKLNVNRQNQAWAPSTIKTTSSRTFKVISLESLSDLVQT